MIIEMGIIAACGYFGWKVRSKIMQKEKSDLYRTAAKQEEKVQID